MRFWLNAFKLSWPRRCFRCVSRTTKLDANIDAVILRQSVQLQTKLSVRPGACVGLGFGNDVRTEEAGELGRDRTGKKGGQVCCTWTSRLRCQTYKCQLYSTTEACGCRFIFFGPAVTGGASQRDVGFGFICGGGHGVYLTRRKIWSRG